MAIFDKYGNRRIQNHFEEIGYPIYYFNNSNEQKYTTDSYWKDYTNSSKLYTEDDNLHDFFVERIRVEGVEKGDRYDIYFNSYSTSPLESIKVYNGKLETSYNSIRIVQTSKGSKYMLDSDVAISEDILETQSEFANFENFEDVDAPDYSVLLGDNPQVATASRMVDVDKLTDSQLKKAEEKLKLEEKALEESLLAKENGTIESAMWTFDEVDALYNTQITTDDKRAYFIYLQNRNRKKLKGGFAEKYGSSYPAQAVDIIELMKKGALFFDPTAKFGERLQPRVIYESGNIYAKWNSLEKNKDYFISRFGESIYNLHVEVLKPIWKEVWDSRLKCDTKDESVRLSMLPISNMANTIKITEVVNPHDREQSEKNFSIYTNFEKGERKEDIAGFKYGANTQYINKKSLSLKDGFIRWCRMAGSGQKAQEIGVQWSTLTPDLENLMNFYLNIKKNPFKKEKGGDEKFARKKDDARKVGIRLFSQFLQEGLSSDDQYKVEFLFNSVYNAYREPNLEQVPIGFTYKKYIDNRGLFVLRKANLNALRYFMTRGSIGLAYGVGLGKTFCSIFVMKQALDLGICERPLVIVPNQVYFQFSQEIQRGLGQEFNPKNKGSRLNMFYNGGGIYNELGNNAVDGINLCTYEATKLFAFDPKTLEQQGTEWLDNAIQVLEMATDELTSNPDIKKQIESKHNTSIFNLEDDEDLSEKLEDDDDDGYDTQIDIDGTLLDENDEDIDFEEGGEVENIISENVDKNKEVIYLNIESTNYDFVCVDEAHNFNNLFEKVVSAPKTIQTGKANKETGKIKIQREINPYSKISETSRNKEASGRATKLWWLSQYIQSKSPMGNTLLLSATPFTNSPLQLYSMLAYLNYQMLSDSELGIVSDFFDLFAKIEYSEDFKTDLSIVKRNKLVGWRNIIAMQKFVYRVFDKSSREEEDEAVIRPNKIVLPLKRIMIEKEVYNLPKENYVSTTIKLSNKQEELWDRVRQYAKKGIDALPYEDLCNEEWQNTTILGKYTKKKKKKSDDDDNSEIDVENADDLADGTKEGEKAKESAKAINCLVWGMQICLNPYLFKCSGYKGKVTAKQYVEASPKMLYIMECIKSIKNFHAESKKSPYMSGQVIYMNFGVLGFNLIRDYIVEELGFEAKEVGIISGKGNFIGKKKYENKQMVADAFLGRKFDKEKEEYVPIPHADRVKVLIGSEAIKEGINLQNYASVLYNAFLDFNPTDIVQVEGRIWRQGNEFANVRIVTPLMSDCIDVFMFKKLEDKTERINQIWTKTGNVNELDTTAFNPSELKYELLTDPKQIAFLEAEYKKEQIDEQIVDESSLLSRNIGYLSIYNAGEKIKYPHIRPFNRGDFYINMYNNIRFLRPDLLDKPLWNREEFNNMLRTIAKVIDKDADLLINDKNYNNPSDWSYTSNSVMNYDYDSPFNWESNKNLSKNIIYREWIGKIYNYSAEELVNIMVTLLKEQKIAYPNGYSKNWREVYKPKTEIPIIEYDEVEYDTKKGRKKGIAEYVLNDSGTSTLEKFYYDTKITYRNIDDDKSNLDKIIKDNKLKIEFDDDFVNQNNFLDTSEEKKKDIAKLMRIIFKDYPNQIIDSQMLYYKPSKLDIGELEEVSVNDKNITRVIPKDEQEKEVKPLKKPDPFKWGSKDFKENIIDIYEYLIMRFRLDISTLYRGRDLIYELAKPVEEQITWNFDLMQNSLLSIIKGNQIYFSYSHSLNKDNISDTWVDFENKFSVPYGLYFAKETKIYENNIPRELAEFRVTQQKVFEPMGISSMSDIQQLIDESKEKINTLKLEQQQLDDSQVFEELVQEVKRRQEELNAEEIRAGSSYLARASNFADSNPDYLGNKMLEVFNNTPISELKEIQKQYRPSDRALAKALEDKKKKDAILGNVEEVEIEEVEVVDEPTKELSSVELLIMDLKETLEFEDNEEVKQKTQELIDDLEEAMLFA